MISSLSSATISYILFLALFLYVYIETDICKTDYREEEIYTLFFITFICSYILYYIVTKIRI